MTKHFSNERTTITLPPAYMDVVRELAAKDYGGNVSAFFRALIETHPVTKSRVPVPTLATRVNST